MANLPFPSRRAATAAAPHSTSHNARVATAASLALALLLAPGRLSGQAVEARDDGGRLIHLGAPAVRVVSLSPAATETLYAIGAGPALVGDTTFCDYPDAAKALPKVGGFAASTISVERIVALRPTLVVGAGAMHSVIEAALAKFSIPVFTYDPSSLAGIGRAMAALGDLTGHGATARAAAADLAARIAAVSTKVASVPQDRRPRVFWEVYDDPLMTCGATTFPHFIIEAAGGRDLFGDLPGQWPRVSGEEVLHRAPDFILGADDHGDKLTVAALAGRPGWKGLEAVKAGRVALIRAEYVSRASPRVAEGVLAVATILYPELFRK